MKVLQFDLGGEEGNVFTDKFVGFFSIKGAPEIRIYTYLRRVLRRGHDVIN